MAWNDNLYNVSGVTASDLGQYLPVKQVASDNTFQLAATTTDDVIGISQASSATYGSPIPVAHLGISKALCAASLGAGCRVAVASTNGGLGPIIPTGAAASGAVRTFAVGRAMQAAAPGDYFPVLIQANELI